MKIGMNKGLRRLARKFVNWNLSAIVYLLCGVLNGLTLLIMVFGVFDALGCCPTWEWSFLWPLVLIGFVPTAIMAFSMYEAWEDWDYNDNPYWNAVRGNYCIIWKEIWANRLISVVIGFAAWIAGTLYTALLMTVTYMLEDMVGNMNDALQIVAGIILGICVICAMVPMMHTTFTLSRWDCVARRWKVMEKEASD